MKRILALLALLLVLPMSAHAWWNAEWKFRKKITIDTTALTADASEVATGVPVAVRLHSGNFLFTDAKPDGSDIRFVAGDDKTPLKHHVEMFDAANQLAILWVQVPRLAAKTPSDAVWLYTGNAKGTPADDAKGVYSPSQRLRLNFSEADGAFKDASPYANLVAAAGVAYGPAGMAGGSALFSGKPLKITMLETAAIKPGSGAGLSWSAWVKPKAAGAGQLFSWGGLTLATANGNLVATLDKLKLNAAGLKAGEWHHVGVSLSDKLVLFVDGKEVVSQAAAMRDFAGDMIVGQGFEGEFDALEVAAVPRTSLWFQLQAAQGAEGTLVAYGEAEQDGAAAAEGGDAGYIGVLVKSLTLDAKIVIVILAVMFAIAIYVMVSKTLILGRISRQNTQFINAFEEEPQKHLDPHSETSKKLRGGTQMSDSSLARMYSTGMRELDRRVSAKADARTPTALTGEAVAAIKASIDSTLIRENQRLSRLMVLLTIAISGGPFLGLLGTVVGVMITFAAIAATGDVNINSIAPGIAAALLATVAGLTVAIPSLFGYNYLITRIKNLTADMQAFSDEFITRMAEAHNQ
jgi:biopolymer transport protein ExbB